MSVHTAIIRSDWHTYYPHTCDVARPAVYEHQHTALNEAAMSIEGTKNAAYKIIVPTGNVYRLAQTYTELYVRQILVTTQCVNKKEPRNVEYSIVSLSGTHRRIFDRQRN